MDSGLTCEITRSSPAWIPADRRALLIAMLGGLFLLRVVGQVLATWLHVQWLPSVGQWQSGLLPYPLLLASQIVIFGLICWMVAGVWRGIGPFARSRPRLAPWVRVFGYVYFASMTARYVATLVVQPDWRWFDHTIPIVFHCILATCLIVYSGVLAGDTPRRARRGKATRAGSK